MLPTNEDLVISHTDLLESNILLLTDQRKGKHTDHPKTLGAMELILIDFEYAARVRPAWELANYAIECELDNNFGPYPYVMQYRENRMTEQELRHLV